MPKYPARLDPLPGRFFGLLDVARDVELHHRPRRVDVAGVVDRLRGEDLVAAGQVAQTCSPSLARVVLAVERALEGPALVGVQGDHAGCRSGHRPVRAQVVDRGAGDEGVRRDGVDLDGRGCRRRGRGRPRRGRARSRRVAVEGDDVSGRSSRPPAPGRCRAWSSTRARSLYVFGLVHVAQLPARARRSEAVL